MCRAGQLSLLLSTQKEGHIEKGPQAVGSSFQRFAKTGLGLAVRDNEKKT
ncbi:hypothetical protein D515_00923 [Grimontia indica]|uniref:Uncharacterized protein n=1 Tax=Grimontia indica TaxID=1056512 RepID=R1IWW3_9GAMM|nr:hypothetical protein D515_00923 [Grimontia indica]